MEFWRRVVTVVKRLPGFIRNEAKILRRLAKPRLAYIRRRAGVRARVAWRTFKRSRYYSSKKAGFQLLALVLLVAYVAYRINTAWQNFHFSFPSLPFEQKWIWIGIGSVMALTLIALVISKTGWRPTLSPVKKTLKWAAVIAIVGFVGYYGYRWLHPTVILRALAPCTVVPDRQGVFPVIATKSGYTETYCLPLGGWRVDWYGENDSQFQVMVNGVSEYSFTPKKSDDVLEKEGKIRTIAFKAMTDRPENITVTVRPPG